MLVADFYHPLSIEVTGSGHCNLQYGGSGRARRTKVDNVELVKNKAAVEVLEQAVLQVHFTIAGTAIEDNGESTEPDNKVSLRGWWIVPMLIVALVAAAGAVATTNSWKRNEFPVYSPMPIQTSIE